MIATMAMSTVSVWLVRAEFAETTSAATDPITFGIKVGRRATGAMRLLNIMIG